MNAFNHKHYASIWNTQGKEEAEKYRESVMPKPGDVQEVETGEDETGTETTTETGSTGTETTPPAAGVAQTSKQELQDTLTKAGISYDLEDSEDALRQKCEANNLL